ncbi:MAG: FAD-binding oxidoreductase, partial [Candidatus Tectomicrobia bacterium]|nr:FAD-binding oxidoreductase [Candidatus Tectomicrobia bacterium]
MDTLFDELRERISGEVRFDKASKILYSTDASIYQIEPIGVVIPKRREDVVETIKIANRHKVPVLPRGGGTSLGGQTVGEAIIIDMSKYLNKIIEINQEEQWVRAEPGIVLDELNAQLRPYGLLFAPDVSTSTHANIGGMIGNNSAGSRSLVYGKTVDHIKELRVVLSNGEETTFREINLEEAFSKGQGNDFESRIYREIRRIASANKEEILKRYPKINRRVSGYNLDEFVKEGGTFNMARMVVGSEGTLATVVEAKINLVPRPKMSALDIIHFESVFDAMDASAEILECNPVAIEMMDKMILDLTKSSPEYSRKRT